MAILMMMAGLQVAPISLYSWIGHYLAFHTWADWQVIICKS